MNDPIVVDHLTKLHGKFRALDDVSFSVKKNSFTGLLGPNGAGKSTMLKIATNLSMPTTGSVYLNGLNVTENPKKALENVGVLVETIEFYQYFTPKEVFRTIGELFGMNKETIATQTEEILMKIKMSEWADKKIGTFSKGMKQRIAIGQTLINKPNIIILDEPTSGLDPRGVAEVREFLKEMKAEDLTILISSHNLHEVSGLCDRAVIINKGHLLKDDVISNIVSSEYSKTVSIKINGEITSEIVEKISGLDNVVSAESINNEIKIQLRGGIDEQTGLLKDISACNIDIYQVSEADELETAYLNLIEESG
ncbi:ABC transporter ATP-binding protein [Candidatus Methanomassiliicoccus intestinalis]|uniref:ABC transporter ATP-binding protein n=1 Tax=Candidatus Methanomassiliicoccus intestinalis TaxID=1406512 RepID=UPI0037DC8EE8